MIKLGLTSPKSAAAFCSVLSILVGFCAMVPVASAPGLVSRSYENIGPRTTIAFHQSGYPIQPFKPGTQDLMESELVTNKSFHSLGAMVDGKLYIDSGFMWYNNGLNHVGPSAYNSPPT